MRIIAKTYNSSNKPLTGRTPQRWRDEQISAQNVLGGYATEKGITNLSDRYLQESVLIRASEGFEANAPKSMMDIINRYAGRTLVGGLGAYTASQVMDGGPFSNPYVATATVLLVMALGGSPKASLAVSKFSSRMSLIEARAIINGAEDGTLPKLGKYTVEGATEHLKDVLYADSLQWIIDEMEGNHADEYQTKESGGRLSGVADVLNQKYGMY